MLELVELKSCLEKNGTILSGVVRFLIRRKASHIFSYDTPSYMNSPQNEGMSFGREKESFV